MAPTYAFVITLSAAIGAPVSYFGPAQPFKDQAACERVLPQAERAVAGIIGRDPDSLALFGIVTGKLTRAYFITDGWCLPGYAVP
jgi:hypothetical protein